MNKYLGFSITPEMFVVNKKSKEWDIEQVQSVIKEKVTINFENVGKKVININKVPIEIIKLKWR